MSISEAQIQQQLIDWLTAHGAIVTRINSGSVLKQTPDGRTYRLKLADKGTSDLIACWPGGLYLGIEVKRPGEQPTPEQVYFLQRVTDAGGLAIVATCIEDIENALRERIANG